MNYYNKYLKYKNKYFELKNQLGGDIISKYRRSDFKALCFYTSFKQHCGECWNDSIQQFFCFHDEIKEQVQRKLLFLSVDEIIQLAEIWGRKKYLPDIFLDQEYGEEEYNKMIKKLKKYLESLKKRFTLYYELNTKEGINGLIESGIKGYPEDNINKYDKRLSINAAICGIKCSDEFRIVSKNDHGGFNSDKTTLCILLSFALLDTGTLILNHKHINNINENDIEGDIAVICSSHKLNTLTGHATLFYKCNGTQLYYDDNLNEEYIKFNYKKFLKYKVDFLKKYRNDNLLSDDYDISENKDIKYDLYFNYNKYPYLRIYTNNIDNNLFLLFRKDEDLIKDSKYIYYNNYWAIHNDKPSDGYLKNAFHIEYLILIKYNNEIKINKKDKLLLTSINLEYELINYDIAIYFHYLFYQIKKYIKIIDPNLIVRYKHSDEIEKTCILSLIILIIHYLNYYVTNITNTIDYIDILLKRGADPNGTNSHAKPIHYAFIVKNLNIFKLLLTYNELNLFLVTGEDGNNILINIINDLNYENKDTLIEYIKLIKNDRRFSKLKDGISLKDMKNKEGKSALMIANEKGYLEIVELLNK